MDLLRRSVSEAPTVTPYLIRIPATAPTTRASAMKDAQPPPVTLSVVAGREWAAEVGAACATYGTVLSTRVKSDGVDLAVRLPSMDGYDGLFQALSDATGGDFVVTIRDVVNGGGRAKVRSRPKPSPTPTTAAVGSPAGQSPLTGSPGGDGDDAAHWSPADGGAGPSGVGHGGRRSSLSYVDIAKGE